MSTDRTSLEGDSQRPGPEPRRLEILLAAILSALLFTLFLVLPLFGVLVIPFAGVPLTRLAHRAGGRAGTLGAALGAVLLLGLGFVNSGKSEALLALFAAVVILLLPALFAASTRHGLEPSHAYLGLCLAGFVCLVGGLALRSLAGGAPMRREIAIAFDQMTPAAIQSYSRAQMDVETIARLKATLAAAKQFATKFWVGLVGASWVLGSAVAFYTGARLARPAASAEATRFETLRIPPAIVAVFVLTGAGSVLLPASARQVSGNLLLPLVALYFVVGLSIICHFARKWFRVRVLRVGLYALVVYFPLNLVVGLLGLFDWYADFRRRGEGAIEKP